MRLEPLAHLDSPPGPYIKSPGGQQGHNTTRIARSAIKRHKNVSYAWDSPCTSKRCAALCCAALRLSSRTWSGFSFASKKLPVSKRAHFLWNTWYINNWNSEKRTPKYIEMCSRDDNLLAGTHRQPEREDDVTLLGAPTFRAVRLMRSVACLISESDFVRVSAEFMVTSSRHVRDYRRTVTRSRSFLVRRNGLQRKTSYR